MPIKGIKSNVVMNALLAGKMGLYAIMKYRNLVKIQSRLIAV